MGPGLSGLRARQKRWDSPQGSAASPERKRGYPDAGKGFAPGDPAFPKQGLAFMHPHRGGFAQGPGEIVIATPGQAMLIEGVAPFVGRGQIGGEGLTRHHPGGDAEIVRAQGAGKGMGAAGTLTAVGVVAPAGQQPIAKGVLKGLWNQGKLLLGMGVWGWLDAGGPGSALQGSGGPDPGGLRLGAP